MSVLNYFFIGVAVAFIIDLLLGIDRIKNHPKVIDKKFGGGERILCVLIWPLTALVFIVAFIIEVFKKFFTK